MVRERRVSDLVGKEVFLPDGRLLGRVHEAVIEPIKMQASHLFVTNTYSLVFLTNPPNLIFQDLVSFSKPQLT